jgi:hypothetical protein
MPTERIDIGTLKAYAGRADTKVYRKFSRLKVGSLDLGVMTPASILIAVRKYEEEVGKDRKKREAKAGVPESERYSEVREFRDWGEHAGATTTPVVSVGIVPRIENNGKFSGDVRGARVYRNGTFVEPIRGGHARVDLQRGYRWLAAGDVADLGVYVLDVECFRPDSTGTPPSIVVSVRDLKSPGKPKCSELPNEVVAQVWNEFEEFYREKRPQAGFRRADPRAASRRASAAKSGRFKNECDWPELQWPEHY